MVGRASARPYNCRIGFVMNFPPGTGYAWGTIEAVFGRVAEELRPKRFSCCAAFPSGNVAEARTLRETGIDVEVTGHDPSLRDPAGFERLVEWVRRERVTLLYLTDQPTFHRRYPALRRAGAKRIIVHDRTSGVRTPRGGLVKLAKRGVHRIPCLSADRFLGVSEFVTNRLVTVNGTPRSRTQTVYNGIELERFEVADRGVLRRELSLGERATIVFTSGRAMPYKGIPVLIRAAHLLGAEGGTGDLHFCYAGDGPALGDFRREAARLRLTNLHFLGKRSDVPALLAGATMAVVPSVWAEAFGLTVVEAMAAGVPVIASRTGGIPELIEHGTSGVLVEPNDEISLAREIARLRDDDPLRARLGAAARARARERFSLERVGADLARVIEATATG